MKRKLLLPTPTSKKLRAEDKQSTSTSSSPTGLRIAQVLFNQRKKYPQPINSSSDNKLSSFELEQILMFKSIDADFKTEDFDEQKPETKLELHDITEQTEEDLAEKILKGMN